MILAASNSDHTAVEILRPAAGNFFGKEVFCNRGVGSKVGERVSIEELEKIAQEKQGVLNPKHKILEKVMPFMKTDENLCASFNGFF